MLDPIRCLIFGAGGHARVLIDALQENRFPDRLGVLDIDSSRWGTTLLTIPVVGDDNCIASLIAAGATHFIVGLGGTADNGPRQRLFATALALGLTPLSVVHPRAIVSRWAQVGLGAQLLAGAIVNAGALLGQNVIVNSGAIVEHDCRLGDHVHIATGARLAGGVRVDTGAHIGAGATVRQSLTIASNAVVGAGAVVVRNVAPMQIVAGVPATPLHSTIVATVQR